MRGEGLGMGEGVGWRVSGWEDYVWEVQYIGLSYVFLFRF